MTVVRPNSIAGINSITVQNGQALNIHDSDGNLIRNIVTATGVGTFHSIEVGSAATVKNNGNAEFAGIVTAAQLVSSGDISVGVSTFFVDASTQRIGIGTADPSGSRLDLFSTGSNISALTLRTDVGANGFVGLAFASNKTKSREKAAIYFQETNNGAHFTGDLVFATNSASGGAAQVSTSDDRLRIKHNGYVGINSSSPDRRLTVYQDATARFNIKSLNNSTAGIEFGDQNDQNAGYMVYDNTDDSFAVGLNGTGEKVSIDSNGNVSLASSVTVTGVCTAGAFIPSKGQLSHRNLIINGAMSVAQRGTSNTTSDQGYRTVDRFTVSWSGLDSVVEQHQGTLSSSDGTPYNLGFRNTWKLVNGDQTGGAGASDYIQAEYRFEAQDLASSGWHYKSTSSYITLSFWMKVSVQQDYTVNLTTFDGTSYRYPMKTGTISANTWTKITKTIPGNSNLDINNDTGKGMAIMWYPYLGNSYVGGSSINAWSTANVSNFGGSPDTGWYTTNDATFEITGVQLEVGEHATPFEHTRYGDELLKCQRYYYKENIANNDFFTGMGMADVDGNTVILNLPFPVVMRQEPTLETTGTAGDYMIRRSTTQTCSSVPAIGGASTPRQGSINFVKSSHGWADGSAVRCGSSGGSHLGFNAEL